MWTLVVNTSLAHLEHYCSTWLSRGQLQLASVCLKETRFAPEVSVVTAPIAAVCNLIVSALLWKEIGKFKKRFCSVNFISPFSLECWVKNNSHEVCIFSFLFPAPQKPQLWCFRSLPHLTMSNHRAHFLREENLIPYFILRAVFLIH